MAIFVSRTSVVPDTTPTAFSFTDQTDVATATTITSAAITVAGINAAAAITISNGTYDVNSSGSFVSTAGTVNNGDTVRARHTSSASNSTAVDTVVTIGGVSDTFTSTTAAGGGAVTADKYVSNVGSNGAAGTSGAPYATIAFALGQISAGQSVGVLTNLTENLAWASLSGGSSGSANHKIVKAITPGLVITGTASGTNANCNLTFQDLQWNVGTSEFSAQSAQRLVFIRCGVTGGGGTSSGNVVQWVMGSNQAYHGCYADGTGGRYPFLAFQADNLLMNECVIRTQANVWGPPASNPTGGFTIYSCTNVDLINCIAVDCLNQGNGSEWLGGFNFPSNVGAQSGITVRQCVVVDSGDLIGIQMDGSGNDSVALVSCVSVRNEYGAVLGTHLTSGSVIPFTGGEYSSNTQDGIADFGSATGSANNVNTTGNGSTNLRGITGSGNTTNALNMNTRLSAFKRYGTTYGLLRGETGWNTATSEDVYPFPNETLLRTKFAAISTRGFCGGSFTLTSYLKR